MNHLCYTCYGSGRTANGSACPACCGTGSVWFYGGSTDDSRPPAPPDDPDMTLATIIGLVLASYLAFKAYTVGFGSVAMNFAVPMGALFGSALVLFRPPWLLNIVRRIIKALLVTGLILLALWFFGTAHGSG